MPELIRNSSITIGTTQVQIAPELVEGERTALTIVNTSTGGQTISISWGEQAVSGVGIVLYPAGSWAESIDGTFIPSNRTISAVSSAAGGTLAIQERIKVRK